MINQKSKNIKINSSQSSQRIDKFLANFYPEKSRSGWQKIIKSGNVLVNNKKTEADYILKENDEMEILETSLKIPLNPFYKMGETFDIKIIYEDNDVIVVDKPAGVLAQKAVSNESPAVSDFLVKSFPEIEEVGEDEQRFGIVHRLDKDTSGVMIIARNNQSFEFLKNQFKNRLTEKIYLALVYGKVKPKEGVIDLKIGRSKTNPQAQTVIDGKKKESLKSREAVTFYKTIKEYENYTLLKVYPKTGRMHQIRVHLKALGFPVVGDKKYFYRKYRNLEPKLERQFLHAQSLVITLPNGAKTEFKSELPEDLNNFLILISSSALS
jgi:23S rRNA pseudouridine1911/1915/1917 synthase